MKIVNWVLCFLFFLSAFLQYNDPDPIAWMLMWGAAGVVCLFFGLGSLPLILPITIALVGLVWAGLLLPRIIETFDSIRWNEIFMQATMSNITVEWAREFGGLIVIAGWMSLLTLQKVKKNA
ncbi:MAG: hypothetical protein CMI18_09465 [Opitutaceae bacterium]|nr:hypothetical protein [Opitutaceae bacterium]|tara:strand:- start:102 stop:467 length:366 start_codon:yes stop_codon:yes gene_type:complete